MKPHLTFPILCAAAFTFGSFSGNAAETPINELLRDALYLEEVNRDTEGAAKQYAVVVSRYEAQRDFAATALFRLAEVRRKQDRKDEAIALYQRLITEFPNSGSQIALAKDNLTSLGGTAPAEMKETAPDPEIKLIAEYEQLRKTSPDVANRPIYLSLAVRNNHLRVVKYLLEKGTDPNARFERGGSNGSHTALSLAAAQGSLALCELLLDAGSKTETPGSLNPLSQAVFKGYPKIVELLLKRGANPNVDSESRENSEYEGTPLTIAARYPNGDIVDQLLKAGADPNLTMPPTTGITPLHFSILYDNEANARKLIAAGARTDLPAKEERNLRIMTSSPENRVISIGSTPLMTCAACGSRGLLELMASNATKEDLSKLLPYTTGTPEKFEWLLSKGANPNVKTSGGIPLLILAIDHPALVQELLDFGADPNITYFGEGKSPSDTEPFTPLRAAARLPGESGIEVTMMLIKAGAKPDEAWMKKLVDGTDDSRISSRKLLFEQFVIPALVQREAVTLAITHPDAVIKPVEIAIPESASPPEELAKLLIQPRNRIEWFKALPHGTSVWPENIAVWRKTEGTTEAFWTGRVTGAEPFPKLQWGDVVQFSFDVPKRQSTSTGLPPSANIEYADKLPFALHWALRKRISFPLQVEVDGQTRTYQMRGDRVALDLTKPELPLLESNQLATLLCPGASNVDIVITRDGSPELRTNSISSNGSVTLRANDKVKLIRIHNEKDDSLEEKRKKRIEVKTMESAIFRSYAWADEMVPPTLVQMLADLLSYSLPEREVPEATEIVEWLLASYYTRTLWMNPDLSDIRIRRLEDNGGEKIIHINLAEKIAASTENTPPADILASDVPLKRGDIVELRLKGDPDGSWNGLSAKEAAFFGKILSCRVQVTDKSRKVSVKHLNYRPLSYVKTDAGKLPVRASNDDEMNVSTLTPYAALGYWQPTVIRNGVSYAGDAGRWLFLQEGDQVSSNEDIISSRRSEVSPSTPRPRVIPSPPNSGVVPVTPKVIPATPSR